MSTQEIMEKEEEKKTISSHICICVRLPSSFCEKTRLQLKAGENKWKLRSGTRVLQKHDQLVSSNKYVVHFYFYIFGKDTNLFHHTCTNTTQTKKKKKIRERKTLQKTKVRYPSRFPIMSSKALDRRWSLLSPLETDSKSWSNFLFNQKKTELTSGPTRKGETPTHEHRQ